MFRADAAFAKPEIYGRPVKQRLTIRRAAWPGKLASFALPVCRGTLKLFASGFTSEFIVIRPELGRTIRVESKAISPNRPSGQLRTPHVAGSDMDG